MKIYEISGDNLHTGHFFKLGNAVKFLVDCGYSEVIPMDTEKGSKAVFHRITNGIFGSTKDQYAYMGWITTEDEP